MTLHLTPDTLAAAYDFLKTTQPFNQWRLPESDEVEFRVTNSPNTYGCYHFLDGKHGIDCSSRLNGYTMTLLETMAHEMTHMRRRLTGTEYKNIVAKPTIHNAAFKKDAKRICAVHGFDPKAFY